MAFTVPVAAIMVEPYAVFVASAVTEVLPSVVIAVSVTVAVSIAVSVKCTVTGAVTGAIVLFRFHPSPSPLLVQSPLLCPPVK
jgi:hypothetical protein